MTRNNKIEQDYFDWLYGIVCNDRFSEDISYRKLLEHLHEVEFIFFVPKDDNRASDGINLRYRYGYYNDKDGIEDYILGPCSVLEMMLALAIRCEETIMTNTKLGDRTGQWFWGMINNLGLGSMHDQNYDCEYVDQCINRFLYREYDADGRGGLFTIRNCNYDLRKIEIWSQLMRYISDND